MRDKRTSRSNLNTDQRQSIPDLDIIDLEDDTFSESGDGYSSESGSMNDYPVPAGADGRKKGLLSHINIHIVLLTVAVIFVIALVYKIKNWGVFIDLDEIFKDGPGTYDDTFDQILPVVDADGQPVYPNYDENISILLFGNAPFADDRNDKNGLANIIEDMTDATVYNCSVSGSYLAALSPVLDTSRAPMDVFNFYWLCTLATGDAIDGTYMNGVAELGDAAPPEAMEVYNTLKSIDLNDIDVIAIMYDASDYLAGHEMYSDENNTDIVQFTGNLEAGIELIQGYSPNTRIIVLSPTYAYGLDENGNYVSSDIQRYGWDVLSTYVIKQYASCAAHSVTFVDNLYGTITEDNAEDYLTDHLHLNVAGRKQVAKRFVYALDYFRESE